MRRTFIEMGLNLSDMTPVYDTFHGVISGQASTPIGRIDLEVSCGTWENKRREMLTFKVANFDIGYNCILGRPFLLKFMTVIYTTYATVKMLGPRGVITLKSDQRDALACDHPRRFGKEEAQKLAAKVAKTYGEGTPAKTVTPGLSARGTSKMHVAKQKQGMTVTPASTQCATDQLVADEKKGATKIKIVFITPFGIFCYTKMAFVLKNGGATYQKCVHTVLEGQIGWNIEAFIDDIVVKSKSLGSA
jgi:hypothetical protein